MSLAATFSIAHPLDWLAANWAEITGLPQRLDAVLARSHAVLSDTARPMSERQTAGRIWADALQDRAEVTKLLAENLRSSSSAGLSALPIIAVIGAVTAATVALSMAYILSRTSAYERELDLIGAGMATPEQIQAIREGAPAEGGVASAIAASTDLLKVALLGAAAYVAYRTWGRGR